MDRGLPYDSDAGRTYAAAVTALMHGEAYAQSARVASAMGPFAGHAKNAEPMLRVIDKHRKHAHMIDSSRVPRGLMQAVYDVWDEAYALAPARLPKQPGDRPGAHRHHRLHDGLRHHGIEPDIRARQVQEAASVAA